METGRTEIVIVLDRSGSMEACAKDTVGGFDHFISEQKKASGEAFLTLAQFDYEYQIVHNQRPIKEVPNLDFHPRGGTALLDAIGKTIISTKERFKTQRPGPDVVLFVIITDGQENSSREFKKDAITAMIKEAEATDQWRFIFLGANQDAFAEAGALGFAGNSTMNYNTHKTGEMFDSLSKNVNRYRSSVAESYTRGFAPDEIKGTVEALNTEKFFDAEDEKNQALDLTNPIDLTNNVNALGNALNQKVDDLKDKGVKRFRTDSTGIKW